MASLAGRISNSELGSALMKVRGGLVSIALLSACLNILTLAGSIYLMMVYDRVLPAQSLPTLFSLFLIIAVTYAFYGAFDVMRSQMLADVATALDRRLATRVQTIEMRIAMERPDTKDRVSPTRDLDQLRGFIASAGPPALMDLPWIIFFLLILTLVHYWLGIVTLMGAIVLAILTFVAERVSKKHVAAVTDASARRRTISDRQWRHAEIIQGLGMRRRIMAQWEDVHLLFLREQSRLTDATATLGGLSKVLRMFLQSSVLTVGAILVIDGKATAGVIFASSILSGRALAPVDQAIANWRGFVTARQSWSRLDNLLQQAPGEKASQVSLPPPAQSIVIDKLSLSPPGARRHTVVDVSFQARAGEAIGIIGPSASGKSSLVRGVLGLWKPMRGTVRLDGATIDQWDSETLGRHLGYLPQSVELFAGSIAENIARFEPEAPSEAVMAAAAAAGVHSMILQLPEGYETQVGEDGTSLSAGQRQRIALARALYRDPFLVVLDEPNSNLDPEGDAALARAITGVKSRGGIVLLVAHRPAVLATVDLVLLMRAGAAQAFGPRDEILAQLNRANQSSRDASGLTVVPQRG